MTILRSSGPIYQAARPAAGKQDILRQKAVRVHKIDKSIRTLLADMAETLESTGGLGLAAPQVGIPMRMFVVKNGTEYLKLINPSITVTEGRQDSPEACLSLPNYRGRVKRPARVVVQALDENGKSFELDGTGRLACTLSHEYDHLDGILYTDKAYAVQRLNISERPLPES